MAAGQRFDRHQTLVRASATVLHRGAPAAVVAGNHQRGRKLILYNEFFLTVQTADPLVESIERETSMFEAIAAFFVILSVGILIAHALDAFRT